MSHQNSSPNSTEVDLFSIVEGIKTFPNYVLIYLIIYSISAVIGIFGNGLVFFIILLNSKMKNARNVFIANLALSDFLVSTIVMPASIIGVVMGKHWHDSSPLYCHLVAIICAPTCIVSMHSISWIAISRYFYVGKYALYQKYFVRNNVILYVCFIWLFGFISHLPNYFNWGQIHYTLMLRYCSPDLDYFPFSLYYALFQVTSITIAFLFYVKIYLVVRSSHLSRSIILGKPCHYETSEEKKVLMSEEIKIIKSTFASFTLFVAASLPGAILLFLGVRDDVPNWVYLYAGLISHENSTLNCLICFHSNEIFRRAAGQLLFGKRRSFGNILRDNRVHPAAVKK